MSGSEPSPFDLVSDNLSKIGALSVERFLSSLSDVLDDRGLQESDPTGTAGEPDLTPTTAFNNDSRSGNAPTANTATKLTPLARLQQECQRRFGNTEALKFEYIEDDGASTKRCILTITRPNGAARCYTTQPVFSRKNEAKAHVASIAIDMGAIEFIITGDQGPYKGRLAPLDAPSQSKANAFIHTPAQPNSKDASIIEIEECCRQWRAGLVKAQWVALHDRKLGNRHGTALRIRLSPHSFKVYSTGLAFTNAFEAKRACAKLALAQGVLDYIKFGNGQTQPAVARDDHESELARLEANADPPVAPVLSLQEFFESLPRPFPESVGDKTATEINAPSWLNVAIQSARGGKLATNFIWTSESRNGSLFGCLLRIERSGEPSKSYLVDTRFSKRADAKAAVCLQAMSEGIGDYIRAISATIESKVTPEMRKYVTERIYPLLASEYAKFRPGTHPSYEYQKDKDAFGCTMKVILSPAPAMDDVRRFIVPAEYRTKADAKTAVTLSAVEQGVVDLLRFRGDPPPPNHVPFKIPPNYCETEEPVSKKRREPEPTGEKDAPRKKRKTNAQSRLGDVSSMQPNDDHYDEDRHPPKSKPPHGGRTPRGNDNRSWKKPHVPSSGGLQSLSDTANAGHPMDPTQSGSRYESGSTLSSRDRHLAQEQAPSRQAPPGLYPSTSSAHAHHNHGRGGGGGGGQVSQHAYNKPPPPPPAPFHGGVYAAQQAQAQALGYGAGGSASAYPLSHYAASGAVPAFGAGHNMQPRGHFPAGLLAAPYAPTSGVESLRHQPSASGYPARHDRQQDNTCSDRVSGAAAAAAGDSGASSSRGSYAPPEVGEISEQSHVGVVGNRKNEQDKALQDTTGEMSHGKGKPETTTAGPSQGKQGKTQSPYHALIDYCDEQGIPRPQFGHQIVAEPRDKPHKMWVVMGLEKLELPVTFSTALEARDRLSKQVLNRLRSSRANKGKGKEGS